MRTSQYLVPTFLLMTVAAAHGAGWNDYTRDITSGYKLSRANSMDVALYPTSGRGERVSIWDYDQVGPIVAYAVSKDHIFTHNLGRKFASGETPDDNLGSIDRSKDFYFVVDRSSGEVVGPLKQSTFKQHQAVQPHAPIDWQAAENPNILKPLFGAIYFLAMTAVFFAPLWLPVALLLAIALLVILKRRRRQKATG
jgi:hypothetical protein